MTDYDLFQMMLQNQKDKKHLVTSEGFASEDDYDMQEDEVTGYKKIVCCRDEVAFSFDDKGQFIGIINFKL